MAFTRFTAADLQTTVVQPEDSICEALKKVEICFRFVAMYEAHKYDPDGKISEAFCAELTECAANTPTA